MKKSMSPMRELIAKISLIFMLLLMPGLSKADINTTGWISNCYQRVEFTGSRNIKMLSMGGFPVFSYGSTIGTAFPYFAIRQYNPVSTLFEDITAIPGYTALPVGSLTLFPNGTTPITLPNNQPIIIDFYGNSPAYLFSHTITVDFINPAEAFKIQPIYQSCFTYSSFQIKNNIINLEGFCGSIGEYKLKVSSAPTPIGLPATYSQNITIYSGAVGSDPFAIPIAQNECLDPEYPDCGTSPGSGPCRCKDFTVEFKLFPCVGRPNCPIETIISIPIKICCNCGFQEPGIPGAGRNTAGTALTGENSELTIFPNPNQNGKLQVSASGHPVQSIKIYTVDGKLVKNVAIKEAINQVSVDISNLQPGIYQVKVMDNTNAVSNKKLVVQ